MISMPILDGVRAAVREMHNNHDHTESLALHDHNEDMWRSVQDGDRLAIQGNGVVVRAPHGEGCRQPHITAIGTCL